MNLLSVLKKRAGLSQEEVAERMGVTPNTISNWETCGKFKKSTDLHPNYEMNTVFSLFLQAKFKWREYNVPKCDIGKEVQPCGF